ncbi:hypothetical protein PQX77_017175 [Marasmius sp. AFHP31]|nr:hypothetical protein PQX77_017175 [Marasmius sp. AFHP31]
MPDSVTSMHAEGSGLGPDPQGTDDAAKQGLLSAPVDQSRLDKRSTGSELPLEHSRVTPEPTRIGDEAGGSGEVLSQVEGATAAEPTFTIAIPVSSHTSEPEKLTPLPREESLDDVAQVDEPAEVAAMNRKRGRNGAQVVKGRIKQKVVVAPTVKNKTRSRAPQAIF